MFWNNEIRCLLTSTLLVSTLATIVATTVATPLLAAAPFRQSAAKSKKQRSPERSKEAPLCWYPP